jgi:peroxiredoxin
MWSDAIPVAHLMRVAPKKAKIAAVSTGKAVAVLFANPGAYVPGCS